MQIAYSGRAKPEKGKLMMREEWLEHNKLGAKDAKNSCAVNIRLIAEGLDRDGNRRRREEGWSI
jgi:hypothetical protein